MSDLRILASLAALAAAPAASSWLADAAMPAPPLPDPKQHNDAWNAAWSTVIATRPLGTARKRAVTLTQLADEQCDQVVNSVSHALESTWLEAWINGYKAGYAADWNAFGPLPGQGQQFGGGGSGLTGPIADDIVTTILDGGTADIDLSPLGMQLASIGAQWRRVVADATANSVPWIQGGNAGEVTINGTKAAIRAFAAAMDVTVEPADFFGQVVHLPVAIAKDAANAALNALLDALAQLVGGAAPYALGGAVLYFAVKR